jgi:hypothetical protein
MAAEGLFVVLPLIVLTIVLIQKGKGARNLFGSPEWSFAGAILMGQTVVKLVYAISSVKRGRIKSAEFMQLLAAVIIVLGLVPSLIILSLVLTSEAPSTGLIWFQILLFVLGLLVFLFFGMLTHWMVAVDRTLPPRVKGRGEEPPTRSA